MYFKQIKKSHDTNKIFFEDLEDNNDDDEKEENHKDNKNEDCWQVPLKCNEIIFEAGWQSPFKGNANNEESLTSENNCCQRVEKAREQKSISEEDLLRFSLFNIHPFIYYLLWDYTWITLVGYISRNRHIRQSLVYLLFDSSPDSEDSRYLDSFLFLRQTA